MSSYIKDIWCKRQLQAAFYFYFGLLHFVIGAIRYHINTSLCHPEVQGIFELPLKRLYSIVLLIDFFS